MSVMWRLVPTFQHLRDQVDAGNSAWLDLVTIGLAVASAVLLIGCRVNSAGLVLGGAIVGLLYALLK